MSGTVSLNPYGTNQPQDAFLLQTQGLVQGAPYDDTVSRMWLDGGTLASTETVVMWGGVPLTELINVAGVSTSSSSDGLGPVLKRATTQANTTGWSTNLQANSMVVTSGNNVPVAAVGNYVAFFRTGTNARLGVQCDPALVAAIQSAGDAINSQALFWDVTNFRITLTTTGGNFALPTSTRLLSVNTNSKIVSFNSGTGAVTWTTGDAAIIIL
jgi:hypothetical protein